MKRYVLGEGYVFLYSKEGNGMDGVGLYEGSEKMTGKRLPDIKLDIPKGFLTEGLKKYRLVIEEL